MNNEQVTEAVPSKGTMCDTEPMEDQTSNVESVKTQPPADGTTGVHDQGEVVESIDKSTMTLMTSTPKPTTSQALSGQCTSISKALLHQDSDTEEYSDQDISTT